MMCNKKTDLLIVVYWAGALIMTLTCTVMPIIDIIIAGFLSSIWIITHVKFNTKYKLKQTNVMVDEDVSEF